MYDTDILIIGAGPAGIFASFQAGMLGMRVQIVDSLSFAGGQCALLYPEKPIYDIPGFKEITAKQLILNLLEQASRFNPIFHFNETVVELVKSDSYIVAKTSSGRIIRSRAIIIAAGGGTFIHNKPKIENIEIFENKTLFFDIKDEKIFRNKNVVIAGGGDSAIDWAVHLADFTNKIFLVHRRDSFSCLPDNVVKLENKVKLNKIEVMIPYQISNIYGNNGIIETVEIRSINCSVVKNINADYVLMFFGFKNDLGPINDWNVEFEKKLIKVNETTMMTSESGIYAIGDVVTYDNKLKFILTAFSEAAIATRSIYRFIFPEKGLHFQHSTSNKDFFK